LPNHHAHRRRSRRKFARLFIAICMLVTMLPFSIFASPTLSTRQLVTNTNRVVGPNPMRLVPAVATNDSAGGGR